MIISKRSCSTWLPLNLNSTFLSFFLQLRLKLQTKESNVLLVDASDWHVLVSSNYLYFLLIIFMNCLSGINLISLCQTTHCKLWTSGLQNLRVPKRLTPKLETRCFLAVSMLFPFESVFQDRVISTTIFE